MVLPATPQAEIHSTLPLVNQRHKSLVYKASAATGLAVAALFAPCEAIKIVGMTVLTGVGYGVTNDVIACQDCIEYFTVGHVYDGKKLDKRPLNTLNPILNALAWGAIATWHVCAIAGAVFALLARISFPGLVSKISAIALAPYLAIGAAITLLVSHASSDIARAVMADRPYPKYEKVPLALQPGWEACNARNTTGYNSLGIGGTILSIAMVAARTGLFVL